MSPSEIISGLFAALQKQETLVAFLDAHEIPWRHQEDGSSCDLTGIAFNPNEERWLARFWDNGNFRDLTWG